jgi:hypothetical protein
MFLGKRIFRNLESFPGTKATGSLANKLYMNAVKKLSRATRDGRKHLLEERDPNGNDSIYWK